jgi:hypothetical protein
MIPENETDIQHALTIWNGRVAHALTTPVATVNMMASLIHDILPTLAKAYDLAKEAGLPIDPLERRQIARLHELSGTFSEVTQRIHQINHDTTQAIKCAIGKNPLMPEDLVRCESWEYLGSIVRSYPFSDEQQSKLLHYDSAYYFPFSGNPILFTRLLNLLIKNALVQGGEIFLRGEDGGNVNLVRFQQNKTDISAENMGFYQYAMKSMAGNITCQPLNENTLEFVLSFPKMDD